MLPTPSLTTSRPNLLRMSMGSSERELKCSGSFRFEIAGLLRFFSYRDKSDLEILESSVSTFVRECGMKVRLLAITAENGVIVWTMTMEIMNGWTSPRRATGCSCKWMTEHGRWFECLYILTTPISNTSIYNFVITPSLPFSQYVMYVSESQLNEQRKQQERLQRNQFKQQAFRDAQQWKIFIDDRRGDIMFISTISGELRSGCISIL